MASQRTIDIDPTFGSGPNRKIGLGETVNVVDVQIAFQLLHEARKENLGSNKGECCDGVEARCSQAPVRLFDTSDWMTELSSAY